MILQLTDLWERITRRLSLFFYKVGDLFRGNIYDYLMNENDALRRQVRQLRNDVIIADTHYAARISNHETTLHHYTIATEGLLRLLEVAALRDGVTEANVVKLIDDLKRTVRR